MTLNMASQHGKNHLKFPFLLFDNLPKESWKFTLIADIQSQIHCKYLNLHIFDMSAPRDILSLNLCNMNLQILNRNH